MPFIGKILIKGRCNVMGRKKDWRNKQRIQRIQQKQEETKSFGTSILSMFCDGANDNRPEAEIFYNSAVILFTTPADDKKPEANILLYVPQYVYGDRSTRDEITALTTSSPEFLAKTFINLEQYAIALMAQNPGWEYDKRDDFHFCDMIGLTSDFLSLKGFGEDVLIEIINRPELLARIIMDELQKIGNEITAALENAK